MMACSSMLNDAQIAELLLRIVSNGKGSAEQLEAIRILYEDLDNRIGAFRHNFETALEEELKRHEMLNVAMLLARDSVHNEVDKIFSHSKLESKLYEYIYPEIIGQEEGNVYIAVTVQMYAGRGPRSSLFKISRADAKHVSNVFDGLSKIELDSANGLYLRRLFYPRIVASTPPVKSPLGELLPFTHLVEIVYAISLPEAMLPELYNKHKQKYVKT